MGKHSARDGATVHPLVADALERRHTGAAPHGEPGSPSRSAHVGWPAAPGRGEGLGWPGDAPAEPVDRHPADDGSVLAVLDEALAREAVQEAADEAAGTQPPAEAEQQPVRRSGWRRLFGGGSTGRSTSAA